MTLGRYDDRNSLFTSGDIDELQISKGIARWTPNFTPPDNEYGPAGTPVANFTATRPWLLHNLSYPPGDACNALIRNNVRIAHAHVERAVHLLVRDVTGLLHPAEYIRGLDRIVEDKAILAQALEI